MKKIKLKNTLRLFHINGETILNIADKSYNFEDKTKFLYTVLNNLDGISIEDLYNKITKEFPDTSLDIIKDIIQQFDDLYFLEDDSKNYSDYHISNNLKERYSRNIDFLGVFCKSDDNKYELQEKIANLKVVLLGLGGVGSHLLLELIGMGFSNIKAIDFDSIELSNLNRQILYNEQHIGLKKIEAAREVINKFCTSNRVIFQDKYIDSVDTVVNLVSGYDLVIICVDRPSNIVSMINEGCVKANIPFIGGGVDTTRTILYSVLPKITGCVQCWQDYSSNSESLRKLNDEELKRDVLQLPPRPAVVNLVAIHAGMLLSEVIKFAIGLPLSSTNKVIQFDFLSLQNSIAEQWQKNVNCTVCGN